MKKQVIACCVSCLFLITSACSAEHKSENFAAFWQEFRQAIANDNWQKICDLSQFPVELKGLDDSSPIAKLNKEQFLKRLPQILEQPVYILEDDEIVETTLKKTLIKADENPSNTLLTDGQARISQLMFIKKPNWRLVRVYVEE